MPRSHFLSAECLVRRAACPAGSESASASCEDAHPPALQPDTPVASPNFMILPGMGRAGQEAARIKRWGMTISSIKHRFRAPWIIFWVGLTLRLACIIVGHTYRIRVPWDHFGFGWEMGRIARSLALGQGYANPFNGPSGPTAWTPPLS